MKSKLKILDFLVHGGHQYEFFKNEADFYCLGVNNELHTNDSLGRPKQENVFFIKNDSLKNFIPDIMMIRAGIKYDNYQYLLKNGVKTIAVVQTHTPFRIPDWCKIVVWNSRITMEKFKKLMPDKKHYHIIHGFDPREFKNINIEKNNRIISSFSLFKQRGEFLGYQDWEEVNFRVKKCDLIGHGNDDIESNIGVFSYPKLVEIYNSYSGYLNTTTHSAMPRSRAEAMMCGTPIITTSNYDTPLYFKHKQNCLIANTSSEMIDAINLLLSSKVIRQDLSNSGRESAIKYFNIIDYLEKWKQILI